MFAERNEATETCRDSFVVGASRIAYYFRRAVSFLEYNCRLLVVVFVLCPLVACFFLELVRTALYPRPQRVLRRCGRSAEIGECVHAAAVEEAAPLPGSFRLPLVKTQRRLPAAPGCWRCGGAASRSCEPGRWFGVLGVLPEGRRHRTH